jgi:DNA-binding transcriptional MerR regulator
MDQQEYDGLRLAEIASKVRFTTEQVARLCGISRRQLSYWVQRGFIPGDGAYTLPAVEKLLLIKGELDQGKSLRQAVQQVESHLADRKRRDEALAAMSDDDLGALFDERLASLENGLARLLEVVAAEPDEDSIHRLHSGLGRVSLSDWLERRTSEPVVDQLRRLDLICLQVEGLLGEVRQPTVVGE